MLHTQPIVPQSSDQYFRSLPTKKKKKEKSYGNLLTCTDFAGTGRKRGDFCFSLMCQKFLLQAPDPISSKTRFKAAPAELSLQVPQPKAARSDSIWPCLDNSRHCSSPAN